MTTIMPIITIFAFYRFHSKNLTFRFHSKYYFPAYLIAYILLVIAGSISDWLPQVPLKFPFLIAAIIYPFFLFKDRYTKRIFCVLFSYLLYMISELLVLFLLSFCLKLDTSSLVSSTLYQSIGSFLADLLLLSIVEIIIRSKKNKPSVIDNFRVELLFIIGINVLFITVLSGLKNVEIRKEIERMQSEALEKAELNISDVVKLVKEIATSGKNETVRLRAMDMLLKYLGAYADDAKLISRLSEDEIEKLANRLIEKLG